MLAAGTAKEEGDAPKRGQRLWIADRAWANHARKFLEKETIAAQLLYSIALGIFI